MKKPSVGMVSLGCPKNLVDSEVMLGLLASQKFTLAPSIDHCDVAVINTCSFIDASRKESLDNIQELAQMKRDGKIKGLIVAGCLGQLQSDTLRDQIPEIDAILGTGEYPRIPQVVDEVAGGGKPWFVDKPTYVYDEKTPRLLLTPRHSAYVKISEGCNHPCSFCIIPRLRGRHRSRTLGSIVEEVRSLSQQGIKEINLVAQDSSFYGFDLVKESLLPQLLNELNQIEGIRWIRVLYLYPKHTTDKILDAFVNNKKIGRAHV